MWADTASYMILLKTTDKSLHMIHNKKKLWTKPFGLGSISKILTRDDKLIVWLFCFVVAMQKTFRLCRNIQKCSEWMLKQVQLPGSGPPLATLVTSI